MKAVNLEAIRQPLFAASRKYLADVKVRLVSKGIAVKIAATEGHRPGEMITDYAQKHRMALIVMATHGYTGFKKLLLGSVAPQVVHESRVPVLLIRPEACHV